MNRQYLFVPAEDELTVLRSLCGLQAQFYGNCLHALHLRCGKAPDENALLTSAAKTWTLRGTLHLIALDDLPLFAALKPEPEAAPPAADPVAEALAGIDPDALSPREALEALYRLKALGA